MWSSDNTSKQKTSADKKYIYNGGKYYEKK